MSKENSKAPLTVAKGANIAQVEATKEVIMPEVPKTLEELKRENEELKQKLSVIPADLENKIQYFNRKKDLIRKLAVIQDNKESIFKHLDNIAQLAAANDFTNDRYFIVITDKENYRDNEVFKIANPVIVGEVLSFVLGRIETKEESIKREIEA